MLKIKLEGPKGVMADYYEIISQFKTFPYMFFV